MSGVIGREQELSLAGDFLDSAGERFSVLLLEGEPGIGKTTVWREVVRRAEAQGFFVLRSRPAEAEKKLAFSALGDLLEPVGNETLTELPDAQRRALEIALLRADPGDRSVDRRTVATALRAVLDQLAQRKPILLAIDDLQWFDAPSARALEHALRRLAAARIGFLAAFRRTDPPGLDLDALADLEHVHRVTVGPVSLAALHHLLKERLDETLPRSTLVRVHDASGGNPLFALEVSRALAETGVPQPGEPLPVPRDVRELVRRRVTKLPRVTRELLLAASALGDPREEVIAEALGRGIAEDLEPAEQQQIAWFDSGAVVFAHPLFAGAIYASATGAERRKMHRRLAEVVEQPEAGARHLALAAEGPNEAAAKKLHAAAAAATVRGAPDTGAELMELALRLTKPGSAEEPERRLDAAHYLHVTGDTLRAREVLSGLDSIRAWPVPLQVRGVTLLGLLIDYSEGTAASIQLGERVIREVSDPELQAVGHLIVSYGLMQQDVPAALVHAHKANELLDDVGDAADPGTLSGALLIRARLELVLGQGLDRDLMERTEAVEALLPPERASTERSAPLFGVWLRWVDDLETSRAVLEGLVRDSEADGQQVGVSVGLLHLALTECLVGRLDAAREHAEAAISLARDLEMGGVSALASFALAFVQAHLGNFEEARALLAGRQSEPGDQDMSTIQAEGLLGFVDLSRGEPERADKHLRIAADAFARVGFGEPGQFRMHADAGEAAVLVGDLERAERIADLLETHGRRTSHKWSLATAARVQALIAAARGEIDDAVAACDRSLEQHEDLLMPIERARTLLVKGMIERRARRRGHAKLSFEKACEIFDLAGAQVWADRARAELGRVGLRRSSGDELTEGERRVAELAARGMTNREVAAALHLSPKTVDANLSRVYRKLGIRSRAELGARMSERVQA